MEDIEEVPIYKGSKKLMTGDLFEIELETGNSGDVEIMVEGDLPRAKRLGQEMSEGRVEVSGDIGMYAGAFMSGGKIEIEGSAGSWAGQKMSGGELVIRDDAENFLGSTFRGDWRGMTGGKITVDGNVGDQAGEWLDGGAIEVEGDAGIHLGFHMKSGVVVVHGDVGDRAGGQMEGGNIVIKGRAEELLPGFSFEEEVEDIGLNEVNLEGRYLKFTGDMAESGSGNLFVSKEKNGHLLP